MGAGYELQVVNQSNAMKGAKGSKRIGFRVKDPKIYTVSVKFNSDFSRPASIL